MSDEFQNPFLTPPKAGTAPTNQQGQGGQPQPMAAPAIQPQVPTDTNVMPSSAPAGQPLTPPGAALSPFAQPQAPVASQPQMPSTNQTPQPMQPMQQMPQATDVQSPPAQSPPVQSPTVQSPPVQSPPAHYGGRSSVIRDTAAEPVSGIKKPSPFDFANQGGGNTHASDNSASGGRQRYQPLRFRGGVGAYYGIVILNYLLTVLTLGIYAPWAKVRKARYFYGNTEFMGEEFQYLATGKQLFIGRVVAIIALVAISLAELLPFVGLAVSFVVIFIAIPWVLNRSVAFKARNAAWRDVRFGWDGSFGMAFLVWMIYPILSILTVGLFQPVAERALRRHYAENHSFGGAKFDADLTLGSFYALFFKATLFGLFLLAVFGGAGAAITYSMLADSFHNDRDIESLLLIASSLSEEQQALLALPIIGSIFALFITGQYYLALARHVMISHLRLQGGIRFRSALSAFYFAWIMTSNLLLIIITLGLATPYAAIRRYRYLTESIEVRPIANMAGFVDNQVKSGFSVFEEASDIEGLSIDI